MLNKQIIGMIAIGGLLLISACSIDIPEEGNLPSWNVTMELPIFETTVALSELIGDSLVQAVPLDGSGDSIFAFRDTMNIDSVTVGDQLNIDPIEQYFVQYASEVQFDSSEQHFSMEMDTVRLDDIHEDIIAEMGIIELTNINADTTNPFVFRDLMPNAQDIEDALVANGGSATLEIDTVDLVPQIQDFAFESFSEIVISSGFMDITIINEMFIALGAPIRVTINNATGDSLFSTIWITEIATGSESTNSIDLSGRTLRGDIQVKVSGISNGSQGDPILVETSDLDSYFRVVISPRDIEVSQADAIVPSQTITEADSIPLDPSETVVDEAELMTGTLSVNINNTMAVIGSIQLTITSLVDNTNQPYLLNIPLPNGSSSVQENITGWVMDMDMADQSIFYEYQIITDDTDPENVILQSTDIVEISLDLQEITFSRVVGQIEQQIISDSGDIDVNSDSQIQEAVISQGDMTISILNGVGGESDVVLSIPRIQDNGSGLLETLHIIPGQNIFTINLTDQSIVMPLDDQRLDYSTATTTIAGFTGEYILTDSIEINILISDLTFSNVTGIISQDAIVEENSIVLNNATKIETALIQSGNLNLIIQNHIGMAAEVNFTIPEFSKGTVLNKTFDIQVTSDPDTTVIPLNGYLLSLPLDNQTINYSSNISIPNNEIVSLSLTDSIEIWVLIDGLTFEDITGIIDPVIIDIDTINQAITALPAELEGIQFDDVGISIEFESNIGVPVFLSLTMSGKNSNGETASSAISNWNISDSNVVVIPNATELINIMPDSIIAYGQATVGEVGVEGNVNTNQYLFGKMLINAPLSLILTEDAKLDLEPSGFDTEFPEQIEEMVLFTDIYNQFDFGAVVNILIASDSLFFDDGTADTLINVSVLPAQTYLDSIILGEYEISLLSDTLNKWIKPYVKMLGRTDDQGNPAPSLFLTSDSMRIGLYGSVKAHIDLNDRGNNE